MRWIFDEVGKKYGRLTVLDRRGSIKDISVWLCRCDCGRETIVRGNSLRMGKTKSCGCLQKEMASKVNKDRIVSPETRLKISLANKGSHRTEEVKHRFSLSRKGRVPWNKGKKMNFSEDWYSKHKLTLEQRNSDPAFQRRRLKACNQKPNKQETKLITLMQVNDLPFRYVGDGSVIIGTKNPDFIHEWDCKLVELFGEYWHGRVMQREYSSAEGRQEYFQRFGYKSLILWDFELKSPELVLGKLREFSHE